MAKKKSNPNQKLQAWIDARGRHRLSHAQVQMAQELGMNPKKLGKLDNHKQEPWKTPLRQFIEDLYFSRFGKKKRPDVVLSIEEKVRAAKEKKAHRRQAKLLRRQAEAADQAKPWLVTHGEACLRRQAIPALSENFTADNRSSRRWNEFAVDC